MVYIKALKEATALQRSYNMSCFFVAQDKNQLETTYGRGSFDQFVTTTDFKVIFRQNEDTTAARFSSLVGKTTKRKKSVSQQDMKLLGSTSINKEGVPLLLPQDFMNQKKNELVVLASGSHERPIKCKCAWWFKDANMKKLIGAYNDMKISDLSHGHFSAEPQKNSSSDLESAVNFRKSETPETDLSSNIINEQSFIDLQDENQLSSENENNNNNEEIADLQFSEQQRVEHDDTESKENVLNF